MRSTFNQRLRQIGCLVVCALPAVAGAADIRDTWRDDANLHAVRFIDRKVGWAVGDHGVAFRTTDGGRSWESRFLPADLTFRTADFLTEDVGWAAGATTTPYTQVVAGAVFQTRDGGRTWKQVNRAPLPRIHAIRFFNERDGIAAGGVNERFASGVMVTHDGGETWESVQSAISTTTAIAVEPKGTGGVPQDSSQPTFNNNGWRAAAFSRIDRGAVVGAQSRRAVVGGGQLLPARSGNPDLRSLQAVAFTDDRNGWAAGEGGTLLRTSDGGLVWQAPESSLPELARRLFDLQAIDAVGSSIWVAGSPGSLVWRSTDGGASWQGLPTGSPLPIHSIDFTSESEGVAVGALGMILRTSDGGTTWQPIRAAARRAAMMAVAPRSDDLSFSLLARLAGDEGYRSIALLPIRADRAGRQQANDLAMCDAVLAAGGNAAVIDWPLPLSVPGLDADQNALVAEWNRVTEGQLAETLVGRLVASIRTWRPDVVILSEPAENDAAGRLIIEATTLAIAQAADPTRFVEQRTALAPWSVKKTYLRNREGQPGDDSIARDGMLTRIGLSVADLAGPAGARIGIVDASATPQETYRLLPTNGGPSAKPFFGGLAIAIGSEARRDVGEPREHPQAALLAARQQTIRRYAAVAFDDPRQAAGLLAQMDDMTAGLSASQASRLLFQVAEAHRARSQWELAERAYLALVERYPLEPSSREAMTWLLRLWTGVEPVWRRMQHRGAQKELIAGSVETLGDRIDRAFQLAEAGIPASTPEQIQQAGLAADPLARTVTPAMLQVAAGVSWNDAQVAHWREQAVRLGGLIRQTDPALFSTAEVQLPLAVAVRTPGGSKADATKLLGRDFLELASNAEMILARPNGGRHTVAVCSKSAVAPNLDGVFSDACWRSAKEVRLATDSAHPLPEGTLTLISYDDRFLYIAASLPRVPGRAVPTIELAGRTHDADLTANDRIVLTLDLDRDFATYFQFAVDERGQTAESCWGDATWNPQWFVSVTGDEHRWRVEAAIPLGDLAPTPPKAGEMWAVSISRVAPAVGTQGWPRPNDGTAQPESFGLMRFE